MLLQNLIAWGTLHTVIRQMLFHQSSLADNSPNFPITKVSLHTVAVNLQDSNKICNNDSTLIL